VEYRKLGTLTMGPLQAGLSIKKGAYLIKEAFERGINFFDTAETYQNYDYLKAAFKGLFPKPVVATKSYAYKAEDMGKSLTDALKKMGLEVIDIFLLHEQESELTIRGHYPALEYLLRAKEKGYVNAVGLSCHTVAAVRDALKFPGIEIIHPMVNIKGIGIKDGTIEEMLDAVKAARSKNIGIYGMKPLGGGHLLNDLQEALNFVISIDSLDSIALGMQSREEILMNEAVFSGKPVPPEYKNKIRTKSRRLIIEDWCEGCGRCVENCPQKALTLKDNKVVVSPGECVLCGYCGACCKEMCIKIF